MPRFVFAVFGSLGDLNPCVAIGRALRGLGYPVAIASHADYAERIAAAGLEFLAIRPSFADLERHTGRDRSRLTAYLLAHPSRLYTHLILPFLRAGVEDLEAALSPDDVLLVTTAAVSARLAAERRGAPWLALALQPSVLWSVQHPPRLPPLDALMEWAIAMGPMAVRGVLALLRLGLTQVGRPIRRLRAEWGLPPQAVDPLLGAALSPYGTLALYSPAFAPLPTDLATPVVATGFARYDATEQGRTVLAPELQTFLAAGSAPIVLTLGSSFVWSPGRFYIDGLAAVRALGRRAVLLMGEAAHHPDQQRLAADDVYVTDYAPYSTLLPHAAAVVHQGGIGTCAQSLVAGIPQLVVPHFGDQPDNAERLHRLGVAEVLSRRRWTTARATDGLTRLLAHPDRQQRCQALAATLAAEHGADTAAQVIATWVSTGRLAATDESGNDRAIRETLATLTSRPDFP